MGVDLGSVEFYTGPVVLGGPDDLEQVVVDFIAGAEAELFVAVQELDSRAVAQAIIAARASTNEVKVKLILEGDYLAEKKRPIDPWIVAGEFEENRVIHGALLRAGIDTITDLNPEIFHQKFIVRDPGLPTAAVLTGSANFTLTDLGHNPPHNPEQPGNNLNHLVILHGQRASREYKAEFDRLWAGTFGALHDRVEPRPAEMRLAGIRVKPLFAPYHGPEMEIMKQMLKARTSVDFAMFTFAQSSGIDDTMFRLVNQIPRLRGVLDRVQGSHAWAATQPLKAAGVALFENKPGTGVRKVHHKLMVIDERIVVAGSFNYTAPAATLNDENIVVIGDLEETPGSEADLAQRRVAAYALHEIERIIAELSRPVT